VLKAYSIHAVTHTKLNHSQFTTFSLFNSQTTRRFDNGLKMKGPAIQ